MAMIRLVRKAVPIALVSLLASAATAHAECAWVLWSEKTNPLSAHASKEACEDFRQVHVLEVAVVGVVPQRRPDLECLPDTPTTETPSECSWILWTYVPLQRPA